MGDITTLIFYYNEAKHRYYAKLGEYNVILLKGENSDKLRLNKRLIAELDTITIDMVPSLIRERAYQSYKKARLLEQILHGE